MHHEPVPSPPRCPACGEPGERSPRRLEHLGRFWCKGRCGMTFYEGGPDEWARAEFVASRERFNREGGYGT